MLLTKWFHEPIWKSKVKVIHWPWAKVIQIQTFSNFFSLKTARLLEAKFLVDPPCDGGIKWTQMVYVTWPRWPPCSYLVKTFKNLILWNQKADDLETWYAALVTRVVASIFKWWPWVDLYLHVFYIKVKIGPFCSLYGKCLSCRFPRNCWSLWGESWYI